MKERDKLTGRRIFRARKMLDLTQAAFANRLGVQRGAVTNWERGGGIKRENLQLISERFPAIPYGWLSTGKGPEPSLDHSHGHTASEPSLASARNIEVIEVDARSGAASIGFDTISTQRLHDVDAWSTDAIRDRWGIPESFARGELRIGRADVRIIEVYGDSMYDPANAGAPGSLFPSDRVIIDCGDRRPSPPGPFVVWDGMGLVVKLVELVRGSEPARIRLKSRNPAYEPYEATEHEAVIIGRVRGRISAM
jgi:phage repressor protein C with HTH and peptisase S24 domain